MKSISILVLCLAAFTAHAQSVQAVKTGNKLSYELLAHDQRGTEVVVATRTPITADISLTDDGRTIKYSTGRIEKYDKDYVLVERTLASGTVTFTGNQRLLWLPKERLPKTPFKAMNTFVFGQCKGEADYEGVATEVPYKLKLFGKDTELKAIQYMLGGRWKGGTCGSGKQSQRIIYSPELDLVVETETLNFLPNNFLNVGNGVRLTAID